MEFLIKPNKNRSLHELQWYDCPTMKDREQCYNSVWTLANDEYKWKAISALVLKNELEIDIVTEQDEYFYNLLDFESHVKFFCEYIDDEWLFILYLIYL